MFNAFEFKLLIDRLWYGICLRLTTSTPLVFLIPITSYKLLSPKDEISKTARPFSSVFALILYV